jgi:hypothetical protein
VRAAAHTLSWCALFVCLGCGAARTPVAAPATFEADQESRGALTLGAREARPGALVLALGARAEDAVVGRVVLVYRGAGGATPELHQTIELERARAGALGAGALFALDREVTPGQTYTYVARLVDDDDPEATQTSSPMVWRCEAPPVAPTASARADARGFVEVEWVPEDATQGALVLRRDLLDPKAQTKRVATLGPGARGVWLDRDVTPGGVYAYRVALTRPGEVPTLGHLSEELFVSLDTTAR